MHKQEEQLLTPLEKEAIRLLLVGGLPMFEQLREQLNHIVAVKREFTPVGFYLNFEVADNVVVLPGEPSFAISDVSGQLETTKHGAAFILFIRSGRISFLEGTTFGDDTWPEQIGEFTLGYNGGARDWAKLQERIEAEIKRKDNSNGSGI